MNRTVHIQGARRWSKIAAIRGNEGYRVPPPHLSNMQAVNLRDIFTGKAFENP